MQVVHNAPRCLPRKEKTTINEEETGVVVCNVNVLVRAQHSTCLVCIHGPRPPCNAINMHITNSMKYRMENCDNLQVQNRIFRIYRQICKCVTRAVHTGGKKQVLKNISLPNIRNVQAQVVSPLTHIPAHGQGRANEEVPVESDINER